MARHAPVCSKSALLERTRDQIRSDELFEQALDSLAADNLIVVHDDSVFRV